MDYQASDIVNALICKSTSLEIENKPDFLIFISNVYYGVTSNGECTSLKYNYISKFLRS
jgi:hypothetical protein